MREQKNNSERLVGVDGRVMNVRRIQGKNIDIERESKESYRWINTYMPLEDNSMAMVWSKESSF